MPPQRRTALLVLAGVVASAASYLFQMQVMATQSPALFVRFNHWLFLAGVVGLPGVLVQSVSNFWQPTNARRRRALLLASGSAGVAVLLAVLFGGTAGRSENALLAVFFLGFLPTSALMGQAQATGNLPAIFWGTLCPVGARAAFYQLIRTQDAAAYRAVALAVGCTVLGLALLLSLAKTESSPPQRPLDRHALLRGAVFALVSTVIPYADFELVRATQSADSVELFGRISLLSRMVLLGGTLLTQAVLPEQLRQFHRGTVETRWWLRRAPLLIFGLALLAAAALCTLVPLLPLPGFTSWSSHERLVLALACINCAALVLVLSEVQAVCTMGELRGIVPALSVLALTWGGIYLYKPPTMPQALMAAGIAYALTALSLYLTKPHSLPSTQA